MTQHHEFDGQRLVMEDERVTVTSMLVDHYTIKPAFAYRFETRDRSVVFSGDTTYYPPLAEFAKGADVLVHEVTYLPALRKLMQTVDNAPTPLDHLVRSHTSTEQVGRIAAAAGVKTLVLSHFVPGGAPPSRTRCGPPMRVGISLATSSSARTFRSSRCRPIRATPMTSMTATTATTAAAPPAAISLTLLTGFPGSIDERWRLVH